MKDEDIRKLEERLSPDSLEALERFDEVISAYKRAEAYQEKKRSEGFFSRMRKRLFP